jgi:hypothetical protein
MAAAVSALTLAAALPVVADPPPAPTYREAVQEAYDLVRDAAPGDTAPAARAAAVLQSTTGQSQLEILADLLRTPPDYQDAEDRLSSLLAALDQPAGTADPALAQRRLHDVLAMSRYDPLHMAPTILDRFVQWIKDRIADLLRLITGNRAGAQAPSILFYLVGIATVVAVAVAVFRSARGRFSEAVSASRRAGPRPPADYFADADRLAVAGDRVGAIRALCAGVAATLAGERTWEGSPLTVREIFQRAPDSAGLLPLLLPFEAAIYGGRGVDEDTYRRAAQVAAPFRGPLEVAA